MLHKIKEKLPDLIIEIVAAALIIFIYRLITGHPGKPEDDTFMMLVIGGILLVFLIILFRYLFNKLINIRVDALLKRRLEKEMVPEIIEFNHTKHEELVQSIAPYSYRYEQFQHYRKKLDGYILEVLEPVKFENHFLISLFTGVYKTLLKDIESGGKNVFYIDSDFYPTILELTDSTDEIIAIADLSDKIETLWWSIPDPNKTNATKRTFLIPWELFFNETELYSFFELLKKHSTFYTVKYNHTPSSISNPIFPDRVGFNMFACNPNIVGYYTKIKSKNLLKITYDAALFKKAYEKINLITNNSIEFSEHFSFRELKRKWINHNKFGYWVWEKTVVEDRDPSYFLHYDIHIRCWIWMYDKMIEELIKLAKNELAEKAHLNTNQVKVLEIGFGTGTLTIPIIEWIENINVALKDKITAKIKYYGVDRAFTKMFPLLENKLKRAKKTNLLSKHLFVDGVVWSSMPESIQNRKFDLIIASFVLHDIISDEPAILLDSFLSESRKWLNISGTIIITDVIPSNNPKEKEEQMSFWGKWMQSNGLEQIEIDRFFSFNQDMLNMISEKNLQRAAAKYGFVTTVNTVPHANGKRSPFKIVILRYLGKTEVLNLSIN